MAHEKIRFGIVGAGAISQGYGQAFQGCGEAVAAKPNELSRPNKPND